MEINLRLDTSVKDEQTAKFLIAIAVAMCGMEVVKGYLALSGGTEVEETPASTTKKKNNAPAKSATPAPEPEAEDEPAVNGTEAGEEITREKLRALAAPFVNSGKEGMDKIAALLKKHKSVHITEMADEVMPGFYADLLKLK